MAKIIQKKWAMQRQLKKQAEELKEVKSQNAHLEEKVSQNDQTLQFVVSKVEKIQNESRHWQNESNESACQRPEQEHHVLFNFKPSAGGGDLPGLNQRHQTDCSAHTVASKCAQCHSC